MSGYYIKQVLLMIGGFIIVAIACRQGDDPGKYPFSWLVGGLSGGFFGWLLHGLTSGDPPKE